MKRILLSIFFLLSGIAALLAVPANPRPYSVVQPNGDTLVVRLQGDERFHFQVTEDGYLIAQNEQGYYCYAQWEETTDAQGKPRKKAVATRKIARNEEQRCHCEKRWLIRHHIPKKAF